MMIAEYVQTHVEFVREEGEVFQGAAWTLAHGYGDCDDHARVAYALAAAGGLPVRLAFLSHGAGDPSHVLTQLQVDGEWLYAETTLRAELGEHPIDAARRLGVVREDIGADSVDVRTMGELGQIEGLTDKLSDNFFDQLVAWERSTGGSAEGAILLMASESDLDPQAGQGHGAQGLNQFMAATIGPKGLKYPGTLDQFRRMTADRQLPWALKFWAELEKSHPGATSNPRDLYWANFLPATVRPGAPDSTIVAGPGMRWGKLTGEQVVHDNHGLSSDGRTITAGDLRAALERQRSRGVVLEALARLAAAEQRATPNAPNVNQAGGISFLAGAAMVLALGAGGYFGAKEIKL